MDNFEKALLQYEQKLFTPYDIGYTEEEQEELEQLQHDLAESLNEEAWLKSIGR